MRRNIQTDVHGSGRGENNYARQYGEFNGNAIRNRNGYNYFKMAELKWLANLLGFSVFFIGILANLGNVLSFILGGLGAVWTTVRILKAYEDYRIRKVERMEKERHYNNGDKNGK